MKTTGQLLLLATFATYGSCWWPFSSDPHKHRESDQDQGYGDQGYAKSHQPEKVGCAGDGSDTGNRYGYSQQNFKENYQSFEDTTLSQVNSGNNGSMLSTLASSSYSTFTSLVSFSSDSSSSSSLSSSSFSTPLSLSSSSLSTPSSLSSSSSYYSSIPSSTYPSSSLSLSSFYSSIPLSTDPSSLPTYTSTPTSLYPSISQESKYSSLDQQPISSPQSSAYTPYTTKVEVESSSSAAPVYPSPSDNGGAPLPVPTATTEEVSTSVYIVSSSVPVCDVQPTSECTPAVKNSTVYSPSVPYCPYNISESSYQNISMIFVLDKSQDEYLSAQNFCNSTGEGVYCYTPQNCKGKCLSTAMISCPDAVFLTCKDSFVCSQPDLRYAGQCVALNDTLPASTCSYASPALMTLASSTVQISTDMPSTSYTATATSMPNRCKGPFPKQFEDWTKSSEAQASQTQASQVQPSQIQRVPYLSSISYSAYSCQTSTGTATATCEIY